MNDNNTLNENIENFEKEGSKVKNNIEAQIRLTTRLFDQKADKRTVRNLTKILEVFYEKSEATPMQIIKNLSLSSSIAYSMISNLMQLNFLEKIRDKKSKRGPVETTPVYKLTSNGLLLLGFLLKKDALILEAWKEDYDHPLFPLAQAAIRNLPKDLILDVIYKTLGTKNPGLKNFFNFFMESKAKIPSERIRQQLEEIYNNLDENDRKLLFYFFKHQAENLYFSRLSGKELQKYYDEIQQDPNSIHYLCQNCRAFMKTKSPFETRVLCNKCMQGR